MASVYDSLNKNIQDTDLKKDEKEEIIRTIENGKEEFCNAIFLLIYEDFKRYSSDFDPNDPYKIPYAGIENNGLEFRLPKFPLRLRRILFKFIKVMQQNQ